MQRDTMLKWQWFSLGLALGVLMGTISLALSMAHSTPQVTTQDLWDIVSDVSEDMEWIATNTSATNIPEFRIGAHTTCLVIYKRLRQLEDHHASK